MIKAALSSLAMLASLSVAPGAHAQSAWDKVAAALGKSGTEMPGQVYRVGFPRTDLKVSVDGVEIKPAFALGGWLAFKSMGADAMVMGDLVLTESEINPVMAKLFAGGLTVTAVHNHLLRAQPATFYMHVAG
jgi:pentose-5-phosphate-3-epimerase